MMPAYRYSRDIPVSAGYDLVVAGGGPAGSAAAICAARLGARVLLIEALGCLGGMGTAGMVCAFDPMANGVDMLVGGFMRELVETLYRRGFVSPAVSPDAWRRDYHRWTPFSAEGLKLVLDELAIQSGVDVRFFTRVIDADMQAAGTVRGVITSSVEGLAYIPAKAFIDATGDAVLSAACGAEVRQAGRDTPHIMPATLPALFAGLDFTKPGLNTQTPAVVTLIEQEYAAGTFEQVDRHLVGLSQIGRHTGYLNGGHVFGLDATNVASLTSGMMQGRRIAQQNEQFLKKYQPSAADMELVATPVVMGIRESRRVLGEYELTYDDYMNRRHFPDQIGLFNKFVDIHAYDTTQEEYGRFTQEHASARLGIGESFGIPYGILVPKGFTNLWVAGRCASADVKVQGSIRVMPACAMMGEAAGTAAVQSVSTGQQANDLNTMTLVETLRAQGANLPQADLSTKMTR